VGAFGLTEPGAGSDAASIRTTATRKGDSYLLNGTKMFITNGPIADVLVVIAVTDQEKKGAGISAFILDKNFPGYSVGRELKKMGVKASTTGELIFEDCPVPAENILRKEGDGFLIALGTVEWDRSTLMAPFLGGLEYALDACVKYAKERVQFGRPIASFQAIQHKLADIKVTMEATRLLIFRVAWLKDRGKLEGQYLSTIRATFSSWNGTHLTELSHMRSGPLTKSPAQDFARWAPGQGL